ncbi:unnamed protein product [Heligmosomoides polygyrus]|uniref:60S ribosomal protein L17 n=1 Tax=Heligmosomoides polygyrus TaxID=6339 RepID=A0A3P7Y9U0_HELPZ|nr:unnamed protein product [Heligmosomoides polygyrus]
MQRTLRSPNPGNAGRERIAVKRKKEAYKLWQKTRAPEHLTAYRKPKRLAKTAVAKAKNAEMDALYEKLGGPEGEKFAIRLAKARHRASLNIRVVKTVKNANGRFPGHVYVEVNLPNGVTTSAENVAIPPKASLPAVGGTPNL